MQLSSSGRLPGGLADDAAPADVVEEDAERALDLLRRHVTGDFLDLVVDLRASEGCTLADARTGRRFLDMTGFFASAALGFNHPGLRGSPGELDIELVTAAIHKPSNPDFATLAQARFVETFLRVLGDEELPYLFFIDGGALAVENALKVAFDWKTRRNAAHARAVAGWRALHLEYAFHGRSGYTLSLTNTDPMKTWGFPVFDWPRIPSPAVLDDALWNWSGLLPDEEAALDVAEAAFRRYPHEIACAVVEPIQCEGGDRHLRGPFLRGLQDLCRRHDSLFILDEIQTGCGATGTTWAYKELGLAPDLVAFGKKMQVCGVMGGRKVLEVPENAFRAVSRISSTWGGNLVDMVRATRILEVIEREDLIEAAASRGAHITARLRACADAFPDLLSAPRGKGLICAVDVADGAIRDRILTVARERHQALFLGAGDRTLRLRPPLSVTIGEIDEALRRLSAAMAEVARERVVATKVESSA